MTRADRPPETACSLDPEARRQRIAMIRAEILPHAERSESLGRGRAWEFANTPAVKEKLEQLVALESECCRDRISFHLHEHAARGVLRLEVRGVDPGARFGAATAAGAGG